MASIATITIADGQATPVNHAFLPVKSGLDSMWKRTGVANQPAVAMESIKAVAKLVEGNGINKVVIDLSVPVLEQVTGGTSAGYVAAPQLAFIQRAQVTFFLPQRSDTAGRKDLRVMMSNLLKDAQIVDLIDNLVPVN